MNKIVLFTCAALVTGALSASTGFTSVKNPDGTQVTRSHVAPSTKITTSQGGCIDSTGSGTCQQVPQQ